MRHRSRRCSYTDWSSMHWNIGPPVLVVESASPGTVHVCDHQNRVPACQSRPRRRHDTAAQPRRDRRGDPPIHPGRGPPGPGPDRPHPRTARPPSPRQGTSPITRHGVVERRGRRLVRRPSADRVGPLDTETLLEAKDRSCRFRHRTPFTAIELMAAQTTAAVLTAKHYGSQVQSHSPQCRSQRHFGSHYFADLVEIIQAVVC